MKRTTLVLAGLLVGVLNLAGCRSATDNQTDLAIKLGEKQARVEQLEDQHKSLQEQVLIGDARTDRLEIENEQLTKQVASLQEQLKVAAVPKVVAPVPVQVPPVAALPEVLAKETKVPEDTTAPLDATASIEKVQSIVTDLEVQIAELRRKLEVANNRVAHLRQTTVDRPAGPPRTVLVCTRPVVVRSPSGYGHQHTASCYTTVPGSPAVSGDFRTAYERESAIQVLREETSPLRLKLAQLTKDHEKAKQELGTLRMLDKTK